MHNHTPWGNHYHKKTYEFFHVLDGKIELKIDSKNHSMLYEFKKGEGFIVEPYDNHTIKNLVECSRLAVSYSRPFNTFNPDIHRRKECEKKSLLPV